MKIYKQEINPNEHIINIMLPKKAVIISAAVQAGRPYFWYSFDPKNERDKTPRYLRIHYTGSDEDSNGVFLATLILEYLVIHIYEIQA